jgi:8-oxo-dGTP diphosphatase
VTTEPNTTSAGAPASGTGGVAVAVFTGPDGVLAGRRRDGTPLWVFPGGRIEAGETPAQAAVRECAEETGVLVTVRSEIGQRVHPVTRQLIVYLSCLVAGDSAPRVAAPDELAEVRWLAGHEVAELMPDLYGPVRDHLVRQSA